MLARGDFAKKQSLLLDLPNSLCASANDMIRGAWLKSACLSLSGNFNSA